MRAPWRLLFFAVAALVALVGVQSVLYPLLAAIVAAAGVRLGAYHLVLVAALLLAHWATLRQVDHRGWSEVGLGRAAARPAPVLLGAAAGALAIGGPSLVLLGAGWLRAEPAPAGSSLAAAASLGFSLAPPALWEELLFRGYPLRVLAGWMGAWPAVCATSLAFGLVHLTNAWSSAQSTALVTLAGFFLGAVLLRTGSLYAAWAAHWAWNWTMAALFHVPVSGIGFTTPDYRVVDAGPDWATGGVWGPEGGAAAALGLVAAMYLLIGRRRPPGAAADLAGDEDRPGTSGAGAAHGAAGRGGH